MVINKKEDLKQIALELRWKVISNSHRTGTPHLGSCLSCLDILTFLYWSKLKIDPRSPKDFDRDRFILSKGHAAPALFFVLGRRGFFPEQDLEKYGQNGTLLGEHPPTPSHMPGVEAATGSLGHGFPMAVGMALAGKISKSQFRTYALLSDGECNEGTTWEAALFAQAQGLVNLSVVVDFNKWQATGRSQEVLKLDVLADKWRAFGFETAEIDGHDFNQMDQVFKDQARRDKPLAVIAHTIKGKGVSFMEDDNNWHYRTPNVDELERARLELGVGL